MRRHPSGRHPAVLFHEMLHTAPSVPVAKRSKCLPGSRHTAVTVAPDCILISARMSSHPSGRHPTVSFHQMLHTAPSLPVAKRSKCLPGSRHTAVTVAPDCILISARMSSHPSGRHPTVSFHQMLHTAPSLPVAKRSKCLPGSRHTAVTVAPDCILISARMSSHPSGRQPTVLFHQMLHTAPSLPVAKRSKCLPGSRHTAVTVSPGCILISARMSSHPSGRHPTVLFHQMLHTAPSVPVAKRSKCLAGSRHTAVTVAPGCILIAG